MTTQWQPYREPLRTTLLRTGLIAIGVGAGLAQWLGGWPRWPAATLLALWPSFGGHWVELWFLNWLRPRIPSSPIIQRVARIAVWFCGGVILGYGMNLTASMLDVRRPAAGFLWCAAGLAFIGIELVVHLVLQLTGRPSFYNGRG